MTKEQAAELIAEIKRMNDVLLAMAQRQEEKEAAAKSGTLNRPRQSLPAAR